MARQEKKNRKHDRNRPWCQAYRLRGQRERNKAVRLLKHLRRYPNRTQARSYFDALPELAKRAASRIT